MTTPHPPLTDDAARCAQDACCTAGTAVTPRDLGWHKAAGQALWFSWTSLLWMTLEGGVGLYAGTRADSISLTGWALSSVVEGLASVIVIWRLTGSRTLSSTSERQAQKAVAVSFWLLAPYIAVRAVWDLIDGTHATASSLGIVLTASSVLIMPVLAKAKHHLGQRLDSGATSGEGTQNLLCAYLAAAVLLGLAANRLVGGWWLDPLIALVLAGVALREGRGAWQGKDCC
jgi:divalent metal cation (Fe/Co/Zn/Cd) transporter